MNRHICVFWIILFLAGCKDNPYHKPIEAVKKDYAFNGIVELGTPVSGAAIHAYEFAGLSKGDKIGEAISNRDETFDLKIMTSYDGPLLLTASGGLYRDLATGEMTALKPSQELSSAITHIKMPEKTNINAWTTLAVSRIVADRGFWDKSVAELKDIDRINVDFSHLSYFLSGKSSNFINIRRQDFFDIEKDSLVIEEPKLSLHIAHGGLSQLAKQLSAKLAEDGIMVSVVDVIDALKDDLSDRVFDGRKADGGVAYVGNNHRISLSSYTMRRDLSGAMLLYLKHLQGTGKLAETDRRVFEVPGRIIDSITHDVRPELFPSSEQPKPLDKDGPKITVRFANEHRHQSPFAILEGNVKFEVGADDESGVQSIKMLEPGTANEEPGSIFGLISANQIPQAMAAARVCSKEIDLENELRERGLAQESLICACFEATDVFDNTSRELVCFQRAIPQAMISFPTNKTILNNKNLLNGFALKAKISSGLLLKKCMWSIRFREENILSGTGEIANNDCIINDLVDGSKFGNGNYNFTLQAEDLAGRILSEEKSVTVFQVYKEPPAVKIDLLLDKNYLAQDFISLTGTNG